MPSRAKAVHNATAPAISMAKRLHTAVADEIHKIAQTDPERAAEMRATSQEYANEVRGFYDSDEPDDHEDDHEDDREYERELPEDFEDDGADYDAKDCQFEGHEDFGWDGGREE